MKKRSLARKPYYPRNTCAMMPGPGSLNNHVDSWCQPALTLPRNRFFPGNQELVRPGHSRPPRVDAHRQPPLTLFGIRERPPRLKCWLQVVVRGGVDAVPRRLPKLGTRFAFEPLFVQAATKTLIPKPEPALYRPRKPQLSDLYQLLETHYDDIKAHWVRIPGHRERRFQPKVNIHSKAS